MRERKTDEEIIKIHEDEYDEYYSRTMRLKRRLKERHDIRHKILSVRLNELCFLSKYMRFFKHFTLIITLIIILFIFHIIGFKVATMIITFILLINEFTLIYMISRLQKRFLAPMSKLQVGVKQIASGDYSVRLKEDVENEVGILTREFNMMAQKLEDGEKVKKEYENNRKDLITNISHDLKTPITSINGYIEALVEGVVTEDKVNNYLKTIASNASYMNKLIDDLFLFSKLDMQKLEFSFVKTNIKDYVYDIVEEFNFTLDERNIKFSYVDSIKDEIYIDLDGKRIHRAIRNLVDNSVKYGFGIDGLEIKIRLYEIDDYIHIDVIDNGHGIEQEKVKSIFDRFYRIDNERTKDLNSTGLGLAIAKEIIEAHNGSIYVSSEVGKGTIFTVKLQKTKDEEISL